MIKMAGRDEPLLSSETRLLKRFYNINDFAWLERERMDETKVSNVFTFITMLILAFNCYE